MSRPAGTAGSISGTSSCRNRGRRSPTARRSTRWRSPRPATPASSWSARRPPDGRLAASIRQARTERRCAQALGSGRGPSGLDAGSGPVRRRAEGRIDIVRRHLAGVWNLQSGRKTRCVDDNKAPLHAVAITPDETTVLTSFQIEDGRDTIYGIIHWDVATWQRKALQVDDHEGRTKGIAAARARHGRRW